MQCAAGHRRTFSGSNLRVRRDRIAECSNRLMGSFTALETGMVIEAKKGEEGGREFDLLVHRSEMEIVAMDFRQYEIAMSAWRHYGKGRHPAGLNIGDCWAYALAKYSGEKLLFKGNDFSKSDILPVWSEADNILETR